MNQKIVFYLISIVLVFFIGYSYSQFNAEKPEPIIITVDNSNEIDEYKSDISNLESQLEEITKLALTRSEFVRESEGKIVLNPLFTWHKQEFGDFHTWFKSRGINYDATMEFSSDVYDDTMAEYEKTCSAFGR